MRRTPTVKTVLLLVVPVVFNVLVYRLLTAMNWHGPAYGHDVQFSCGYALVGAVLSWSILPLIPAVMFQSPETTTKFCCGLGCFFLAVNALVESYYFEIFGRFAFDVGVAIASKVFGPLLLFEPAAMIYDSLFRESVLMLLAFYAIWLAAYSFYGMNLARSCRAVEPIPA
jgi:hypothetical protein